MRGVAVDEDGEEYPCNSSFARKLDAKVQEHVDAKMQAIAETHVLPNVSEFIEELVLNETNQWGERKGKTWTLTEFMVEKCNRYMMEKVDWQGHTKANGGYNWSGKLTRLEWMVSKFLDDRINEAVKLWMKTAAESLGKSIEDTVKDQLAVVTKKLKVAVAIDR